MSETLSDAATYLGAQSLMGLIGLFWFTVIFEVPRYTLSFLSVVVYRLRARPVIRRRKVETVGKVTVVVAGYNEEDSVRKCVLSLREQSLPPDEIIVVSDGSTDNMPRVLTELLSEGLIDRAHATDLRAGKSAAVNLAERWATGDIIVNVDCDCSYDRHALRNIVAPLADPEVAAVSGNILVRNPHAGLIATFQAIEYLISISLGKQAADLIDQVVCVSGAFGAFRRTAMASVNGLDVGGGEDLDLSLKLRKAGWKVRFEDTAICYTDTPDTLRALTNQRFRWERDAVRSRYRKHLDMLNPFSERFRFAEMVHEIDFIVFQIIGAAILPVYIVWLVLTYGELGLVFMLAAQLGLVVFDMTVFALAALATPKASTLSLIFYVPGYSLFNGIYMRFVRLFAYAQEWIFNASADDNYVPEKVRLVRKW
jgi:cellulose synthase/poly-beta-1,6-N-acetylglucosamine synthase-like glycosyltransferase